VFHHWRTKGAAEFGNENIGLGFGIEKTERIEEDMGSTNLSLFTDNFVV
jgi:hypothetical protein